MVTGQNSVNQEENYRSCVGNVIMPWRNKFDCPLGDHEFRINDVQSPEQK